MHTKLIHHDLKANLLNVPSYRMYYVNFFSESRQDLDWMILPPKAKNDDDFTQINCNNFHNCTSQNFQTTANEKFKVCSTTNEVLLFDFNLARLQCCIQCRRTT
jgi:hypothetical protein